MKHIILALLVMWTIYCPAQNSDSLEICKIMLEQEACWNKGDIECFMEAYWNSDSLMFIGKSGITYGWKKTLKHYQSAYPDKASMGELKFDILHLQLEAGAAAVVGKWHLTRETGDVGGYFSLLWKKLNGKWVIVSDHTS